MERKIENGTYGYRMDQSPKEMAIAGTVSVIAAVLVRVLLSVRTVDDPNFSTAFNFTILWLVIDAVIVIFEADPIIAIRIKHKNDLII